MKLLKDFSSRKEWEEFLWEEVLGFILESKDKSGLKQKLESLFSKHERSLALRRLTAILLLKEGLSYRKIGEILWVAPATISTIKKSFSGKSGYLGRKNKIKDFNKVALFKSGQHQENRISIFFSELEDFLDTILEGYNNPRKRWKFLSKHR